MRSYIHHTVSSIFIAALLAACGGGGSGGSSPTSSTAEGIYGGTLTGSNSSAFQMLVLENDELWAMYGSQTSAGFLVSGFLQGQGQSSNGGYTSSNLRDFGYSPALAGTASAGYNTSTKTIAGSTSFSGTTVAFNGGPISGSLYNYASAASLTTVAGAWTLTSLSGESVALNVASGGTFAAVGSSGCTFTGSLTPRASGKNVFNLSISFGAAPCALANQSASGIALAYPLSNGKVQLLLAGSDAGRTLGTAASGTR